jgi:hypothetical protein
MRTSLLTAFTISCVTLGVACGGDSGGSNALSEAEFCDKIASVEGAADVEADMTTMLAVLADLADSAPTKELREAIETIGPIMQELEGVDENDPDAFAKAMEIMMDPKVVAAGETLEKFTTETCGLTDTTDAPSDDMSSDGGSGDIFDDMSAGDISDYVDANGADYFPNGYVGSTSMNSAGDYTDITMDFVDADSVDGVAICELIGEFIAGATADTAVRIVVQADATDIAVREVDGSCAAV